MIETASFEILTQNIQKLISVSTGEENVLKMFFTERRLIKKQFLLNEGDVCAYENYVVRGSFRSFYVDKEGDEHTLHLAIDDHWITDLESFMYGTPSSIYIQALEPSEVLQIEKKKLDLLLSEKPIFETFFRLLHQRAYIAQTNRILDNIALNGQERYIKFSNKFPALINRIPQKYLASYLGMTPVFLSQLQNSKKIKIV